MFKGPKAHRISVALPPVVALTLLLASCGGGKEAQPPPPAAEAAPNIVQPGAPGERSETLSADELRALEAPTYNDIDVAFMQGMIHHHAQALRMTRLVPKRSTRKDIPLLAERMDISQVAEIEQMQRWLTERTESAPVLHRLHGHAHGLGLNAMPGMLSEQQLVQLERADGIAFDRLFLRAMIRHHRGAQTMVRQLYEAGGGVEAETDSVARHIDADQEIEIVRMEQLLTALR